MTHAMKRSLVWLLLGGLAVARPPVLAAKPVLRVVKASEMGKPLLRNGDFEQTGQGGFPGWQAAAKGFEVGTGQGRGGSGTLVCDTRQSQGWFGASQSVQLNRTAAAPLVVRGWSKAENVTGGSDSGYSLYVDLVYADGTPLWGQTGNFRCGTHDWQPREFVILPDKPVKTLTVHCLFRGHTGKVWFDDVTVEEVKAEVGAVLFQGVPVVPVDAGSLLGSPVQRVLTNAAAAGVFLARDVAANSDFHSFENGACPELGLKLTTEFIVRSNHTVIQGRLSDLKGQDRAVTLVFALPVEGGGWHWGDDIRRSRAIEGNGEFANQVAVHCGATGTMSLYPLAAIWNDQAGLALALDMARPAQYRLGCQAGLKLLHVACDFGLVKETKHFPSSADFRFVCYGFEPRWGFRAAFEKLTEILPEYFKVRSKEQGIWMPFTDVSTVQGWEDFGFRYHEGNNNVPWDNAHGILSFRYTEPMTWWMPMKKETPRTLPEALRIREEMAQDRNGSQRRLAEASRVAAMFDETGQPGLMFRDEPWCRGAVWSLNPNPFLEAQRPASIAATNAPDVARPSFNAATIHWNDTIRHQLYGPAAKGQLDGEYLDSLEGYVTAELNFRREHFRDSTVPLSFAGDTRQPALFKGLAVFEFTKWISGEVHGLGKLMFANGVPYRFTFLCPWLDVLGTETDWLRGGKYQPASLTQMDLWRTMSGGKPYLLLMNTDYDQFNPGMVEKYFNRCLFYGMWPGFFSHNASENPYWQNPKWYNRDRPLFKKYLPLIKRVAEAGWQPVTGAGCDNDKILVERFGRASDGPVCLTLFNDTSEPQTGRLRWEDAKLRPAGQPDAARDLLSGKEWKLSQASLEIVLPPQQSALFEFNEPPINK